MVEYGRIHTDGSRSGGQPTQSDCEVAASIRSALYRACSNMPNYPKGIVEPFVAAHHRHGYDQGYYDGCARQLTQSDALQAEIENLRHDLERQMTIANEQVNEAERLREALRFYAREANYRSMTMYMCGQGGKTAVEIDAGSRAIVALQEQSK